MSRHWRSIANEYKWLPPVLIALAVVTILFLVVAVFPPLLAGGEDSENEVRATLLQALAGVILVLGLYFTYRTFDLNRQGQVTDRFTKAINQLGEDTKLDVRLGGIYALERIALDSERDHWPVMEVLTAYVREHRSVKQREEPPSDSTAAVRDDASMFEAVATDTQAIMTVIGRRKVAYDRSGYHLNLTTANLAGVDLSSANLASADLTWADLYRSKLTEANLAGARLKEAGLDQADLTGANLEGASLVGAHFENAHLDETNLQGADLTRASLEGSHLRKANLTQADLAGARLSSAYLEGADLQGADLTNANLIGSHLEEANLASANLHRANLNKADLAGVNLVGANLAGANLFDALLLDQTRLEGAMIDPETRASVDLLSLGARMVHKYARSDRKT